MRVIQSGYQLLISHCKDLKRAKESSRLLVSPECFAGRTKFFCGPSEASYSGAWTKTYYLITIGRKEKKDQKIHQVNRRHYIMQNESSASRRRDYYFIIKLELLLTGMKYIVLIKISMNEV